MSNISLNYIQNEFKIVIFCEFKYEFENEYEYINMNMNLNAKLQYYICLLWHLV